MNTVIIYAAICFAAAGGFGAVIGAVARKMLSARRTPQAENAPPEQLPS
ncbi:hypothetical protein [Mycolicibacterium aubagnense]|nr:hypothetical protein [Mycolicibacterium aubagnense]